MISLQDADDRLPRQLLDWVLPQTESIGLETKRVSGKMVGKALETICASLACFYFPARIIRPQARLLFVIRGFG